MKFNNKNCRVIIEAKSMEDIKVYYEHRPLHRGWCKMTPRIHNKFLTAKLKWTITLVTAVDNADNEHVVDVTTPCGIKEANGILKNLIDSVMVNHSLVYYLHATIAPMGATK